MGHGVGGGPGGDSHHGQDRYSYADGGGPQAGTPGLGVLPVSWCRRHDILVSGKNEQTVTSWATGSNSYRTVRNNVSDIGGSVWGSRPVVRG